MSKTMRNPYISIIRVVAMVSIVVGHICTWKGINTYQLGAIGVEIFLFISGYLYGNRDIFNRRQWLMNRGRRVLIPFWIVAIFMTVCILWKDGIIVACKQLLSAALNLQGLSYLIPRAGIKLHYIGGLGHCWFVTMIMLCYVLMAFIKETKFEKLIDNNNILFLLLSVIGQIVLALIGIQISYIIQFFFGYFFCRTEKTKNLSSDWLVRVAFFPMLVVILIRLITRHFFDGTVMYDYIVARLSFNVLGTWLFGAMIYVCNKFSVMSARLAGNVAWKAVDKLSYSVFLVHYMFVTSPFNTEDYITGTVAQIVCMLLLSIGSAVVLSHLVDIISAFMERKKYG